MTISYDKLPMFFQTLLDIDMVEGIGVLAHDIARPPAVAEDHTMTLTGVPTWVQLPLANLTVLSFNPGDPDFLELAAAQSVSMDFQVGAFSVLAWIYPDDLTAWRYIIERGLNITDGWYFCVSPAGQLLLSTNQAGVIQSSGSFGGDITIGRWWCAGAARLGNSVRIYINGNDVTSLVGNHINPAACARKLHVGIDDTEAGSAWDGYIWRPRVWGRRVSASEMRDIFEMERGFFNV